MSAATSDMPLPASPTFRSCQDCGHAQRVPISLPGMVAQCRRCGATLRQGWTDPLGFGLALSLASAVMLAIGSTSVLAIVERAGQRRTADLLSGPVALAQHGLWELAALVVTVTVLAPVMMVGLSLYTLIGLRLRRTPPRIRGAFALRNRLRPWAMIEVFLVGYFVAYAKLGVLVHIEPGPGFYALFGFMVATVATDAILDPQAVWEEIGRRSSISPPRAAAPATSARPGLVCCPTCRLACDTVDAPAQCPRCGFALHRRKSGSLARTAALGASGLILYVPANVFPVLTVVQLGRGSPSTILGGVWELLAASQLPLAAIVFVASIAVPVLKLLGLGTMLAVAVRGRTSHLRQLTVLYRVVAAIGRWSMIDIFMESILAALVQFGSVATIDPGGGAIAFAAVVVLTMLAAESFDPRLMWDKASR